MKKNSIQIIGAIALLPLFCWHANVSASTSLPTKTPLDEVETVTQETTSMPMLLLQTVFILAVVVAVIYFLLRFVGRRSQSFFGRAGIRTLGGCSLGPQKSLQIVQIGSALYIVGVGENVTLLRCIEEQEEVEGLLETLESRSASSAISGTMPVKVWMGRLLKREGKQREEELAASFQMKMEEARRRRESMQQELFMDREKEEDR
jgi:flagellar protein FliO/FliZ